MYATVQDIRNEGITLEQATDARIDMAIKLATNIIDSFTGQWFEERPCIYQFDGHGAPTIFLKVPPISVEQVKINGEIINLSEVLVYGGPKYRNNPRLYYAPGFPRGKQNVEVTGKFGYVESDGSTPEPIKYACRKLVISYLTALADGTAQDEKRRNRIVSETTDGHSYTLAKEERPAGLSGDPEVDSILAQYMAIPGIGSA